jgi:hypothetical protein
MTEQFVPYEIALKLKEKHFNEQCLAFFNGVGDDMLQPIDTDFINFREIGDCVAAPLWQQVIDWLREKHSLDIMTRQLQLDGRAYYKITKIETEDKIKGYSNFCKSPYEAREKAINQALTLI